MKKYVLIMLLLISHITVAQNDADDTPAILGGLDWSFDGKYLAVATTAGVYIHRSDDLSVVEVIDDSLNVHTVDWSHEGYQLAFDDWRNAAIIVYSLEMKQHRHIVIPGAKQLTTESVRWHPDDTLIAVGIEIPSFDDFIERAMIIDVATEEIVAEIEVPTHEAGVLDLRLDWSPDGKYLYTGSTYEHALIWDAEKHEPAYTIHFPTLPETKRYPTFADTMKWDWTGKRMAGGWNGGVFVRDARTGEVLHSLVREWGIEFYGMSWHPGDDKLAIVVYRWWDKLGSIDDSVMIWDINTDEVIELFDIVYTPDNNYTQNAVQWSPDGNKLASMSSDGRIIIWETENYEVIAEYDGYRSLVSEGDE